MIQWLDTIGYRMCWGSGWLAFQWSRIWYHYRCPYPIITDHSARACVESGHCGCSNLDRYSPKSSGNRKGEA
jgi:hypothetical protein